MILNKHSCQNFQLVELLIAANSANTKYFFPEQNLLRGRVVDKVEYYPSRAANPAPSGNAAGLTSPTAYLTLVNDVGEEFLQNIPVQELIGVFTQFLRNTQTFNGPFVIVPTKINWSKSYISYPEPNALGSNYSILFGVYYRK